MAMPTNPLSLICCYRKHSSDIAMSFPSRIKSLKKTEKKKKPFKKLSFLRYFKVIIKVKIWDLPGCSVVKTSPSSAEGVGSIPGQGAKTPHPPWSKNGNIKQKQYFSKFNKDF